MKTHRVLPGLLLFCLVSSGFAQTPGAPVEVVASLNSFGLRLHRKLAAQNPDRNLVHSPYSLGSSMVALSCGAEGETLAEMKRALALPSEEDLLSGFEGFHKSLGESLQTSGGVSLRIASRLYVQKGCDVESRFRLSLKKVFRTDLENANFKDSAPGERRTINSWVEQQTGGAFREFLPPNLPTAETGILSVNAVVFRAPWYHFETKDTHTGFFNLPGGRTASLPFMVMKFGNIRAEKKEGHSAVSLDFPGSQFSFLVLVPGADVPLAKLEASLTPESLAAYPRMTEREAKLYLPRFNLLHSSPSLKETMNTLGLGGLFAPNQPNFSRLSGKMPFRLADMVHQARIKVDEGGVYAAAATASGIEPFGSPPEPPLIIKADRPFLFAIQHSKSGACLFLGRVTDPR